MSAPSPSPRAPRLTFGGVALCVAATALLAPVIVALASMISAMAPGARFGGLLAPVGLLLGVVILAATLVETAARGPAHARGLLAFDVFVVLPAAGLALTQWELEKTCVVGGCSVGVARPIHMPEGWGLLALHFAAALAWAVSQRRPQALRPRVEAAVLGAMLGGIALHLALAVQFVTQLPGALIPVLGWSVLSPYLALLYLTREAWSRLRRRGEEARTPLPAADGLYRDAPASPALTPVALRPWITSAAAPALALLGAQAVLQALLFHDARGLVWTFTQTCAGPLSMLTRVVEPAGDCHYLCTVAAQGHPWLVGPERLGMRHGHPVVVNRQLATANAFEELLHTRWPRFGRVARRTYDALGYPVSRHLKSRWVADAVYLAMKPAEWVFYLALLLLDPGDPEARLGRMYR